MARSPVTRAQVDAYRFGLRRMDAALVRRDSVLLHEEIRGQRRTVAAGGVLAMLGLAVAAGYGLLFPSPTWTNHPMVVGRQSGALYVVAHGPDRLVPVANLAAGRLVLAAISPDAASGQATPVVVDDRDLASATRTAAAAVPGAASALPGAGPGLPPQWAVCDEAPTEPGRAPALRGTSVVAGVAPQGQPMDADRALLLRGSAGQVHLVHHGKRQRVELTDRRVTAAFDLAGRTPRPATDGLLSAIPEAVPLRVPSVPGAGTPAPGDLPGLVGGVVRSAPPGAAERFYAVLAAGIQEVSPTVAELLRAPGDSGSAPVVPWDLVAALPNKPVLDVADHPTALLRLLEPAEAPTVCLASSPDGRTDGRPAAELVVGQRPPTPDGLVVTRLAQADGPGPRLDAVYLPAGQGAAVRGVTPGQQPGTGALWLISDTGVAYGVPDADSAAALGITAASAAPEALLRMLPTGPPLELAVARRTVDALDAAPG